MREYVNRCIANGEVLTVEGLFSAIADDFAAACLKALSNIEE